MILKISAGNCIVGVPFLWNYIAAFQRVEKVLRDFFEFKLRQ